VGPAIVNDIIVSPLKLIQVNGGDVLHAMKKTDNGYIGFSEAYFSEINTGHIKGWKCHLQMTLNLIVPIGKVKFVFFDNQKRYREEIIGHERYARITVPPLIWFAFQGISDSKSLILNIADVTHDPSEVQRKDLNDIYYKWETFS
jgi:dTDP-4-dehydrorhamnose 3,5-epimerase